MSLYLESLNSALHTLCGSKSVCILGEDILDPYGGAFKVTKGLSTMFPDKVYTTPISEAAIVGIAGGMALRGMRPIVEIMFGDFITLCMDQIVNHIAKYYAMYDQQVEVPLVIRTPMGGGRGYGPTHSQSLEKMLFGIPHIKIISPSRFHNPGELLCNAVNDLVPVIFVEHKILYPSFLIFQNEIPFPFQIEYLGNEKFPTVVLKNYTSGNPDVVVITYGGGSYKLEELLLRLSDEEIQVVCLLPSLVNEVDVGVLASFATLAKAGTIVWEEGTSGFNWGSEIISLLYRKLENKLGKVIQLGAIPTVIPSARELEKAVIPGLGHLEEAILSLVGDLY